MLQKFSISDTNSTQRYVAKKGLKETPGGPGEIIPPSILRHVARFLGGLSRSGSDHTGMPGTRMMATASPQSDLQRTP